MTYLSLKQTADALGIKYGKLFYAINTKQLTPSHTVAGVKAFSDADIPPLKAFFSVSPYERRKAAKCCCRSGSTKGNPSCPCRNGICGG